MSVDIDTVECPDGAIAGSSRTERSFDLVSSAGAVADIKRAKQKARVFVTYTKRI